MAAAFKTWQEAHDYAQAKADESGLSLGIENLKSPLDNTPWRVKFIPAAKYRCWIDYTCEAVEPSRIRS